MEHGGEAGLKDVDLVDGGGVDGDDSGCEGGGEDGGEEGVALGFGEAFGVVEGEDGGEGGVETDGGGDDGSGERAASGFVCADEEGEGRGGPSEAAFDVAGSLGGERRWWGRGIGRPEGGLGRRAGGLGGAFGHGKGPWQRVHGAEKAQHSFSFFLWSYYALRRVRRGARTR